MLDMKLGGMAGSPCLRVSDRRRGEEGGNLDIFGIAILDKGRSNVRTGDVMDPLADAGLLWREDETSVCSEGKASVVLAESPSRLDLSALLC